METQQIAVADIDDARSLELSPREALDNETVERYMLTLDELPPIDVWDVEGEASLLVADGLHRLRAAKRNKAETIAAVMHAGTMTEFMESAILANLLHGRAWTRAEKRNCIDAWLKIHTDRTNQWIADDLRVSQNTVADRRESLETDLQIEELEVVIGQGLDNGPAMAGNPGQAQAQTLDTDRQTLQADLDKARQRERELLEERDWLRRELTATREALGNLAKALPPAPAEPDRRSWWKRLLGR